jgi:Fe-S-cluster containining protein
MVDFKKAPLAARLRRGGEAPEEQRAGKMPNLIPIAADESFRFACSPEVPCFNACCRDLNQFLTPYDILRLKNHLRLSSLEFLARYTSRHMGPESGLPIVTFRTDRNDQLRCPFVTPDGCRVYENRPSSCRTYPLVRMVSRSRQTGETKEQFMLITEPHCSGFDHGNTQTVREWLRAQNTALYNEVNDKLMEIISLKNQLRPGRLDVQSRYLFYTALYDLDNFRSMLLDGDLFQTVSLEAANLDAALEDDVALLTLGMQWIKQVLLGA